MSVRATSATIAAACVSVVGLSAVPTSLGQGSIAAKQSRASSLRAAITAETRRIDATDGDLQQAQVRVDALEADLTARRRKLQKVNSELLAARNRLLRLERRMEQATTALSANLRHDYMTPRPDLVSVISQADSFADLLEVREFLQRIARRDADILDNARSTKKQVAVEAGQLVELQETNRKLAADLARRRDRATAARAAIAAVKARQQAKRNGKQAELNAVNGQIAEIRKREAAEARRLARLARSTVPSNITVDFGGMAKASAGAPDVVAKVIAAGNAIATLPYVWGGGHGSFQANGYDCSGSVSYALAAGGLLSSPLDSTGFMSWGDAGPGKYITVYANAGHAFMVIDGWRFDTSARSQSGTRWTRQMRPTGGFVARHPPGL